MSGWWRWLAGFLLLGVMLAGLYSARSRLLPAAAGWLDVGARPPQSDYVMVLQGDEDVRPYVAAGLMRVGLARRVIVARSSTSADRLEKGLPSGEEIVRRVLLLRGVSEDQILTLKGQATNTYEEAEALAAWPEFGPKSRVTVVTSFYHTRRARWVFKRVLGDKAGRVLLVSAPADKFRSDNWWHVDEGARVILAEYLKLAFYLARYGGLGWAAACGVVVLLALACWRRRVRRRVKAGRAQCGRPLTAKAR